MDGVGHRSLGFASFVATAPLLPDHGKSLVVTGIVAVASSSGRMFSPDADQGWLWRLVDRWVPDEKILGDNGPMQHRGITHFWLWPLLAYLLADNGITITAGVNTHVAVFSAAPILYGLAIGWGSHDLGDLLVGAAGDGRPAGIPMAPWGWWVGTGAKCGGVTEWAITSAALPLAVYLLGAHAGLYEPLGVFSAWS